MRPYPIINGRLYQSGHLQPAQLAVFGAILDLTQEGDHVLPNQKFKHVPLLDEPVVPAQNKLDEAVDWVLNQIHAGRKVLVHCYAGRNRSGLINALVVKKLLGLTGTQSVQYIRQHAPGSLTNEVFARFVAKGKRA